MVAVIRSGRNLRRILNYNEQKVIAGQASILDAVGYPKDAAQLNFYQKLSVLEKLTALNQETRVNSVHISLNFDPSEKISEARLKDIAEAYMQAIGFGEQPYLLYQHFDSGHPHIHLVTTNIKADGRRIELHNLGMNQSEKARKELEIRFGLVRAEQGRQEEVFRLNPVNVQKVYYGRVESKRAMENVISSVLRHYQYGSLAELNAILQLYNITADRGSENSRMYDKQGLVYRILDKQGNKVGVPVKASDFYFKPTLRYLSEKFIGNSVRREQHKAKLKNTIDLFLLTSRLSMDQFRERLRKEGIDMVVRQNEAGVIYGLTYVDHRSKCVFNGSALGKAYSAKGILERCSFSVKGVQEVNRPDAGKKQHESDVPPVHVSEHQVNSDAEIAVSSITYRRLADTLLHQELPSEQMDWQLKRHRKKKKRPRIIPE